MKAKGLSLLVLLAAAALSAEEGPSVDLFAGWTWFPYACDYPYGPYDSWWRDDGRTFGPYVGVGRRWPYAQDPMAWRYGYAPYPYYWGFDYGVHLKIRPGSPVRLPGPGDRVLLPLPGSAPTALRDEAQEKAWEPEIAAFLATLPTASGPQAATNAPAGR